MKKFYYLLTGFIMVFVMFLMPNSAFASETVPVTTVKDITDVEAVEPTVFEVGEGKYDNVVQFKLEKPGYVYVSASSTVMIEKWYNQGAITDFAVYSDENCSKLVKNDENVAVWGDKPESKYLALDAGTYWIHFAKNNVEENDDKQSKGEFSLYVAVEYLDVTGTKNTSWGKATKIDTDKEVTGFLSSATRTNWYQFKVANGTTARISASMDNPLGVDKFPVSTTGVTVYKSNHKQVAYFNVADKYYDKATSDTMVLSEGTYYIGVTGDTSYCDILDPTKLTKNEFNNMGRVNLKVVTIKKPSISKVVNVKGTKAQVTYKAVSGAKGYEVQYSTDSKFKSGTKVVKANAKTTKVTLSKLKKGTKYYVRVRAYKSDAEGKKLTSSWSGVKSVKITK